jgi:hypothetical protein
LLRRLVKFAGVSKQNQDIGGKHKQVQSFGCSTHYFYYIPASTQRHKIYYNLEIFILRNVIALFCCGGWRSFAKEENS